MKAVRYAGAAVCLALAAYFMAPLVMGILHIGMVYPAALLALAAAEQTYLSHGIVLAQEGLAQNGFTMQK